MKKLLLFGALAFSVNSFAQNDYSLEFGGVDGVVSIPQDNSLKILGDLTIIMDIYLPSTNTNWNHVLAHGILSPTDPNDNVNYFLQIPPNTSDLMYVHEYSNGLNEQITCPVPLLLSQWNHVAIVRDTTNKLVKFYLEGVLVSTQPYTNNPDNGINGSLRFGNIISSGNGFLYGSMDNISIWETALDSCTVGGYTNCLPVGNEIGLAGYWDFEEGTGVSTQDNSSNFNNGTLSGGVLWSSNVRSYICTANMDTQTSCGSYTWMDGITYTTSNNIATWTLTNASGCDSIVTLDLTITQLPDNNVSQSGNLLTADQAGATYQWLDCDDNNAIINGETNQSYTPVVTGNFAVEVTLNGCADTSACMLVDYTGIEELYNGDKELVKVVDLMGRETTPQKNMVLIYVYSDGTTERIFEFE